MELSHVAAVVVFVGAYVLIATERIAQDMAKFGITNEGGGVVYDWREQHESFEVMNPSPVEGLVDVQLDVQLPVVTAEVRH